MYATQPDSVNRSAPLVQAACELTGKDAAKAGFTIVSCKGTSHRHGDYVTVKLVQQAENGRKFKVVVTFHYGWNLIDYQVR